MCKISRVLNVQAQGEAKLNPDESLQLLLAQMKDHGYPKEKRRFRIRVPFMIYNPIRKEYQAMRDVSWMFHDLVPEDVRQVRKLLTKFFRILSRLELEQVHAHLDEWLAQISNS